MTRSRGEAQGAGADLVALVQVLHAPARTFRQLRGRHPVLVPWLAASVVTVALSLLTLSISQRAAAHLIGPHDSPELADDVQANLDRMKWVSVAGAPVGLIARWSALALALWGPAVLLTGSAAYRPLLSIVAYSAAPGLLGRGLDLGAAWFQGPEFTPEMLPTFSSAGSLGALLPGVQSPWPMALLDGLTVFGIWTLVLWTVGLRERLRLGWAGAVGIAGPVWLGVWILGAAFQVMTQAMAGEVPMS